MSEGPHMGGECNPMDRHLNSMSFHVPGTFKGETHTLNVTYTRHDHGDINIITSYASQCDIGKNNTKGDGSNPDVS